MELLNRAGRLAVGGVAVASLAALSALTGAPPSGAVPTTFLGSLHNQITIGSTVPANTDLNPYGVAVVPTSMGLLHAGDTLVSNFNDATNVQGTGTSIVELAPTGDLTFFANITTLPPVDQCPGGIGLTTALGILPGGWVVVGSLPTDDGTLPTANPAGCLIVLDDWGSVVETFTNQMIDAPWDMATTSSGSTAQLFVADALGATSYSKGGVPVAGTSDVVRLNLTLEATAPPVLTSTTVIGTGFPFHANPAALVLAPTGLALAPNGTLYVDDSLNSYVAAIPSATVRRTSVVAAGAIISSHGSLNAPLGMTLAPDGDVVVVNGDNGTAVEISPSGRQVATKSLIATGAGDLFGVALTPEGTGLLFVNDGTNTLRLETPGT